MSGLRLFVQLIEQSIRRPVSPPSIVSCDALRKTRVSIASRTRELVVPEIVTTLRKSTLRWGRGTTNAGSTHQPQWIYVRDWVAADICVGVDSPSQSNSVGLQVPSRLRIVVSEVVVV